MSEQISKVVVALTAAEEIIRLVKMSIKKSETPDIDAIIARLNELKASPYLETE